MTGAPVVAATTGMLAGAPVAAEQKAGAPEAGAPAAGASEAGAPEAARAQAGPRPRKRPSPADLEAARDAVIADVIAPGLRVLFAGINPGLYSAATGYHFARSGNRFWPALHQSGFTTRQLRPDEQDQLLAAGLGITNVVARATAKAGELDPAELRAGGAELAAKVARFRPRWLAVAGVTAYRTAFGQPGASVGPQRRLLAGTPVWVLPNPSGLNALWTTPRLTEAFQDLRLHVDG